MHQQLIVMSMGKKTTVTGDRLRALLPLRASDGTSDGIDSQSVYSYRMNEVSGEDFYSREALALGLEPKVLKPGYPSYQRFRTLLIFRHVIAYALVQACAALASAESVERNLGNVDLIDLTLTGNGWGLLVYAAKRRAKRELQDEAHRILQLVLRVFREGGANAEELARIENIKVGSVTIIGEGAECGEAKTAVAKGALVYYSANAQGQEVALPAHDRTVCYTGVSIESLKVDEREPISVRWCDPWTLDHIRKVAFEADYPVDGLTSLSFELPREIDKPCDPILSVFTRIANELRPAEDPMAPEEWRAMNADLQRARYLDINQLEGMSPLNVFLSRILYPDKGTESTRFMKTMAQRANCLDAKKP